MYMFQEFRDRLRGWFGQGKLKNARVRRFMLGGLFFAFLTIILSQQVSPRRLNLKVDDLAPYDLVAPRDIENRLATLRKRQNAAAAIPMQKQVDPQVLRSAEEHIMNAFQDIRSVRDLPNQDERTKLETLSGRINLGGGASREMYAALLRLDDQALMFGQQAALSLMQEVLSGSVRSEDVADIRSRIDQDPTGRLLGVSPADLRTFVKELVKSRVRSNLVDDPAATARIREQAAAAETPVIIKRGECCIIEQKKRVTPDQLEMLKELGLIGARADFRSLAGTSVISLILIGLLALHLIRHRPDIYEQDSKLLLLGIIGALTLMLSVVMRAFTDTLGPGVAYLMPIAFNSMLVTILLDSKLALLQSTLLALIAGITIEVDQINHVLVMVVGGVVGVYAVSRVESRTDIYRAGLIVAGANVATILSIYLVQAFSILDLRIWIDAGVGAVNGLMVAVLVTGALPFFENLFGVITPLKLLELSNPNHLLLKKLLVEAPGSYHHTILVANLCEAAAEAIGADQVLCRVGAYYHDIGKSKRPYFFVENQFGGENPHDKLPPSLSALIITSHVKDGLEMAREARLPQEIVDFIPEHHGTSLVSYFYHMASKSGQAEYVLEEDFRYDGPKPRSKETAICMLADGCEASVRAMRQKGHLTVDQIEAQVRRIVEDRLHQGQLENCDLTFRELEVIQKTFVKMLSGVHHARIDYPGEAVPARLMPPASPAAQATEEGSPRDHLDQQRPGEGGADGGAGGSDPPGGGGGL